jgi:hypothetical protein
MGSTVETLRKIEKLMEIQSHLVTSPTKKEALYKVQKHKYNSKRGCFVACFTEEQFNSVDCVVRWRFKDLNEIMTIFKGGEARKMLTKRINFSEPENNFVLVTALDGGPSYVNSYYWNEFTPLKVPGVANMVCSAHPVAP